MEKPSWNRVKLCGCNSCLILMASQQLVFIVQFNRRRSMKFYVGIALKASLYCVSLFAAGSNWQYLTVKVSIEIFRISCKALTAIFSGKILNISALIPCIV